MDGLVARFDEVIKLRLLGWHWQEIADLYDDCTAAELIVMVQETLQKEDTDELPTMHRSHLHRKRD